MRTPFKRLFSRAPIFASAFCCTIGATLLAPSDAAASGYLTARYGSDDGTPAMANAYAIYFNPGALGGTTGTTITGDVSAVVRWASYERTTDALSPSDPNSKNDPAYVSANTGRANLLNILALPFLSVNTDFGGSERFRAGWAVYIPFGGQANWTKREGVPGIPGTIDGVSRWHNISGQILSVYNTFAFAVKLPAHLSIGASVSPIYHTVKTVRARNADGSDDTVSGTNLIEGRSLLEAHGLNIGAALGLYWEPNDRLKLGLSYTSQPGFGETKMSGTLSNQVTSAQPGKADVDFYQTLPDILRLGAVVGATRKLDIRSDLELVRWSVFDKQCVVPKGQKCNVADDGRDLSGGQVVLNIPRRWNNTIGVRVGPAYQLNDRLQLIGSAGFATPAVPKSTIDASTIDGLQLLGAIGLRFVLNEHLAFGAAYNHIHYFTVDTKGANDQDISAHPANQPATATQPAGSDYNVSRSPSADGRYKSEVGFLNLNVAYTF